MLWSIAFVNMPGPKFLLLYAGVIIVILGVSWFWIRCQDQTEHLALPEIPNEPDPYKIAYLRGGENEVTRLAILALIEKGYLKIKQGLSSTSRISKTVDAPDERHLSKLGKAVFTYFHIPRDADDVFEQLPAIINPYCEQTRRGLEDAQLLHPQDLAGTQM